MPLDNAGNTFTTARKLTLTTNIQSFSDWVGTSDMDDFYSLNLTSRSSLNLAVDGLSSNVNLQIVKDTNKNGSYEIGEALAGSYNTGNTGEAIRQTFDAGNYCIRVYSKGGDTNYNLRVFENVTPTALEFQLNNTVLNPTDTLKVNSAWVSDINGAKDVTKVDFWIKRADGTGINVTDANIFTTDINDPTKANFNYSLSLTNFNLEAGNYTLKGRAYDETGKAITATEKSFTIQTSISTTTSTTTTTPTTTTTSTTTTTTTPTTTTTSTTTVKDWFSQNLLDQQIATLARNFAADGSLNRQDMLGIFRDAQDNSVIDANEVNDLKALLGTSTPFSLQDPVKWLSTQVANSATIDMSASSFESKVGQWFLGTVAPTPIFNGSKLTYTEIKGNLYGSANEARIGDIDQGRLGDCAFLAALGATFGRQSNDAGNASSSVINSMITDNGDKTYTMRFYYNGTAEYVTVDRRVATGVASQANNGIIWSPLVEKAYAQWREWREGRPGYNLIGNGDTLSRPLRFITGRQSSYVDPNSINSFSTIEAALASGKAVTAGAMSNTTYVVGSHAYSVTNVYINASGEKRFVVRNPWGIDGKARSGSDDGFIDLSFDEFKNSFDYGVNIA
ncbi:C2 family cysteine protease [Nostoc sp. TCL26-01]|uniref:C2 family cysteine protease n=1 Tax=Nostoc sp. TCL26-01 TaxID=2576904 RepID=UPI0015BF0EC7|nr:C2 family cysteine protease [Nostoc sp. TCL26-01]QLE59157.1 peptidase [Nostoc sp. TCL26-01]